MIRIYKEGKLIHFIDYTSNQEDLPEVYFDYRDHLTVNFVTNQISMPRVILHIDNEKFDMLYPVLKLKDIKDNDRNRFSKPMKMYVNKIEKFFNKIKFSLNYIRPSFVAKFLNVAVSDDMTSTLDIFLTKFNTLNNLRLTQTLVNENISIVYIITHKNQFEHSPDLSKEEVELLKNYMSEFRTSEKTTVKLKLVKALKIGKLLKGEL